MSTRLFDFKSVSLAHIDTGSARIGPIEASSLPFTDDAGTPR